MRMIVAAINASIALSFGIIAYDDYHTKSTQEREATIEVLLERFDEEERYCMTQNIFFEARNQSELGQEAVARVTLNRVNSQRYPNTICEVVWQNKQFSWTHDGKPDVPSTSTLEQRAWSQAEEVTNKVLRDFVTNEPDITQGATHYHADYVRPFWADAYNHVITIESHIFYR